MNALPSPDALATALSALVAAGASNELLGQVTRELVGQLPRDNGAPRSGRVEGSAGEPAEPIDAERKDAPATPVTGLTGIAASERKAASLAKQPAQRPVIIDFKENGERSSVSIPAKDWTQLLQIQPDAGELRALVRATAVGGRPPAGAPRSGWVLAQVKERLREA